MLTSSAPPRRAVAARCTSTNRRGRATSCAPRIASTGAHDYGDDDEFYDYLARVEITGEGRSRSSKSSSSKRGSSRPSAVRLSIGGGAPEPAVLVTVAVGRTAFQSGAETGGGSTSLILEDDGAWPMERSRRRAFSLSGGGPGAGGDANEDDDEDGGGGFGNPGAFAIEFVAGSRLRLRGEARGFEVAISSAGGWPSDSADGCWDAAVAMAKGRATGHGGGGGGGGGSGHDDDAAARGMRALVLRRPVPSGAGAGAWRCFASGVPVVLDARLPDGSRWRGLRGTMVLDRRRGWGAGGGGRSAVAAAVRRRRALARALASPPWLRSPWED